MDKLSKISITILLCLHAVFSSAQNCENHCISILTPTTTSDTSINSNNYIDTLAQLSQTCDSCYFYLYEAYLDELLKERSKNQFKNQRKIIVDIFAVLPKIIQGDSLDRHFRYVNTKLRLGHYYTSIGALSKSKLQYLEVIDLISDPNINRDLFETNNIANQALGRIAFQHNNYYEALRHYHYAIESELEYAEHVGKDPVVWSIYSRIGEVYAAMGEDSLAYTEYAKSVNFIVKRIQEIPLEEAKQVAYFIVPRLLTKADLDIRYNNKKEALNLINLADQLIDIRNPRILDNYISRLKYYKKYNNTNGYDLLIEKSNKLIRNNFTDSLLLIDYLTFKVKEDISNQQFERAFRITSNIQGILSRYKGDEVNYANLILSNDQIYLFLAQQLDLSDELLAYYNHVSDQIQETLQQNIRFDDHINNVSLYYHILEQGLHYLYTEQPERFDLMFDLMESTKAVKLYLELKKSKIQINTNPNELAKFKENRSQLYQYKRQQSKGDSTLELSNKIFELEREVQNADKVLHSTSNLTTNLLNKVSLSEFQNAIVDRELYLIYFAGQSNYYALYISKHQIKYERLAPNRLDSLITEYYESIKEQRALSLCTNISKQLFKALNLQYFTSYPSWVVSSDGLINFVSFESLMHQDSFLVETHDIRYIPSAHIEYYLNNEPMAKDITTAVFSPQFENEDNWGTLKFAAKEAVDVKSISSGKLFAGNAATKDNFLKTAEHYKVIHLATHAFYNSERPEWSRIQFTLDSIPEQSALYFNEINSLNINAELLSLSACETGMGANVKGEGLQSLARNFIATGCRSVVSALWSISDQTTSEIVTSFYQHLFTGTDKSHALSLAKRAYLKNHIGEDRHPYYWAGIILTGRDQPIPLRNNNIWYGVLIGILALPLIFLLVYKWKKSI